MEQHASTIETPGPFDALGKAEPGEPMFPLLGRDPAAPGTITEWARLRRNLAIKQYGTDPKGKGKKLLAAELAQCANAEAAAMEFAEWRSGNSEADQPGRVNYSGGTRTAEELAEAARATTQLEAVRHLREAAYHVNEAREKLVALDLIKDMSGLRVIREDVNAYADFYTPKREG